MSIRSLRKGIARNLVNFSGWQTTRKIIVIESDDWGSIRMPSRQVYDKLLNSGIPINKDPYCRYDSLESEVDLIGLFEILVKHKDNNGNHPIITTNMVVANPDFEKIRESNFEKYFFKPFTDAYNSIPNGKNSFNLINQGITNKIILPQFHGREHVNVNLWLRELKQNNPTIKKAFDMGLWGLSAGILGNNKINIQAAFDTEKFEEIESHKQIIKEGLELFHTIFGFKAMSFIANNYIWDSELNKTLYDSGVSILQGMKYQISPLYNYKSHSLIRHKTGEFNNIKQMYLVRNCHFEPSLFSAINSVDSCLKDIQNAFRWNKPAIISSHRINFIGSIIESNRNNNLKLFDQLLYNIIKKWPDVEFMSTIQLSNLIENHRK